MNDEKIIGPLNLLQAIYLALGVGVIYFLNDHLSQEILIGVGILVAAVVFTAIKQAESPPLTPEYYSNKRSELGPEKFKKWIQRKIDMIDGQITVFESKGKPVDPMYLKAKQDLEKKRDE